MISHPTSTALRTAPQTAPPSYERYLADAQRRRRQRRASDDWPHTKRVLPWMMAAFITMLWLVPFGVISLSISLPIDLYLDRIVLPVIAVAWIAALVVGGPEAPRVRLTKIHVAIGVFVAIAYLSVALRAHALNQALVWNDSLRELVLLTAYASFFVMLASVVRRTEVPAFLTLQVLLAVACAMGTLWESRFHYNVFYQLSSALLPDALFTVPLYDSSAIDEIGRPVIRGPAELGLETTAMLSMAVPLALIGFIHAKRMMKRIGYGLVLCILMAASLSTFRKTGLIAPVVVMLSLGFFRRRELLRLAPLAVVLVVVVHVLSPGAIGGVTAQLTGERLANDNTTNHRAAGYEAIRPLFMTHPALGQGYGSYDAYANYILDSEILTELLEVGVIGLAAYLIMILSVVAVATPLIRRRDPERAPPALVAALCAIAFLTVSFLYDAMHFPHAPYIFLTMAALLAAVVSDPDEREGHRARS